MKTKFNSFDIVCTITELQRCIGMRVNNIYDIDIKTYLIRLQRGEEKVVLLLQSGNRIHSTSFEWPKNIAPSGFTMKLRKHLKNKRLESLLQMGSDRIIKLQFGSDKAAYHVILELYDRGNIVLTDYEMVILNVLRPHMEGDKAKFAVREKYPENRARESVALSKKELQKILQSAEAGESLKKVLLPHLEYGPALLEHVLLNHGFANGAKIGKTFDIESDITALLDAIQEAQHLMDSAKKQPCKGYIIQKREERMSTNPDVQNTDFFSNQEFHPLLFIQHSSAPYKEFDSFNEAADEFFSTLEGQKVELKIFQQEREAWKKLENIRKDHDQRLTALEKTQESDKHKAELITRNQHLVENAIMAIQSALANQVSWSDINTLVKEATAKGDPIAKHIKQLKLETNHISLHLTDPFQAVDDDYSDEDGDEHNFLPSATVDIDLALSAFANARKYYDQKRSAAKKQQKTIESQDKALKSAERKTKQALKEVQAITNINKARKVYWFEKFFWFISSENYAIIAGRDQEQNEIIVKRYMKPNDIYVHAEVHGASSIIIKNPTGQPVPPKTLNEAGVMAICYRYTRERKKQYLTFGRKLGQGELCLDPSLSNFISGWYSAVKLTSDEFKPNSPCPNFLQKVSVAWEAKVISNAYWVWGEQVSKTAPTGEYLTTGSFMIRGKKNFLPPSHLVLGMSFMFRLEEGCAEKHRGERKVVGNEDHAISDMSAISKEDEEEEIVISEDSEEENDDAEESNAATNEKTKETENNSKGDYDDNEDNTFPDTHIKILHSEGNKIDIVTEGVLEERQTNERVPTNPNNMNVFSRTIAKPSKNEEQTKSKDETFKQNQNQTKRGQKSKLKKIKEKYRYQDEEERKLRMDILQSAGAPKEVKKNKKGKEMQYNKNNKRGPALPKFTKILAPKGNALEEGEEEEVTVPVDLDMLELLTGQPLADDELLFAIPVIAPYNTLSNYKFKVKLTPGSDRRGKAAKTALNIFLKDKTTTQREKDLIRAVKDEQLARNLPGKVKLSAPKLQMLKKS